MGRRNTLPPEVSERVRAALRGLMAARDWNQQQAGAELGVTQQALSSFLSARSDASLPLVWQIARATRADIHELLTGQRFQGSQRFRDLPGWDAGRAAAERFAGARLPAAAFVCAGELRLPQPPRVLDADTVLAFARVCWEFLPAAEPDSEQDEEKGDMSFKPSSTANSTR